MLFSFQSVSFGQWLLEAFFMATTNSNVSPASGFYGTPWLEKDEVRLAYVLNNGCYNLQWIVWK